MRDGEKGSRGPRSEGGSNLHSAYWQMSNGKSSTIAMKSGRIKAGFGRV
jgi:hypothetical protein